MPSLSQKLADEIEAWSDAESASEDEIFEMRRASARSASSNVVFLEKFVNKWENTPQPKYFGDVGNNGKSIEDDYHDFLLERGDNLDDIERETLTFRQFLEAKRPDLLARNVGSTWTEKVTRPTLPEKAPALWAEAKEPGDTPPTFIQRHYAPWLGKGLSRADVRHLDPQLYMALANWRRKNDLPEGFALPTKSEKLAAEAPSADSHEAAAVRRLAYRLDKARSRSQ